MLTTLIQDVDEPVSLLVRLNCLFVKLMVVVACGTLGCVGSVIGGKY